MKTRGFWYQRERWRLVTQLMARDGTNCTICGEPLDRKLRDVHHHRYITFDHIVPRSAGGSDATTNKRLAHAVCNWKRGNDPVPIDDEVRA
jgi:5-methylcytosine-specific restriction endonuclease McrA